MEFIDLKRQYQYLKQDIDKNIDDVINSTGFILGDKVEQFETELADFVNRKYAITCSDGTAALQLIYMAYGIGAGDVVFCPDMTFIASIEPACLLGATPVFCDIEKDSYNIDPDSLERQINQVIEEGKLRPRAIVAVDFLGNPADFSRLRQIAEKYQLLLIEDAAQGMGASYRGAKCCSCSEIAATSFFPSKPLGCYGDGGAVFTDDENIDKIIRSLRVHGKGKTKYDNIRIGINSRLDAIQAAVLLPKLHVLEEEIAKRQKIARTYSENLGQYLKCPVINKECISAYAQYVVVAESEEQRTTILETLKENCIPTILYYPTPMHLLPVFEGNENYGEKFENAVWYSKHSFGIPFSPYISEEEQTLVIKTIQSVFVK